MNQSKQKSIVPSITTQSERRRLLVCYNGSRKIHKWTLQICSPKCYPLMDNVSFLVPYCTTFEVFAQGFQPLVAMVSVPPARFHRGLYKQVYVVLYGLWEWKSDLQGLFDTGKCLLYTVVWSHRNAALSGLTSVQFWFHSPKSITTSFTLLVVTFVCILFITLSNPYPLFLSSKYGIDKLHSILGYGQTDKGFLR